MGPPFELASKGSGTRIYGDTVIEKTLPVLAYGEVWQRGLHLQVRSKAASPASTPTATDSRCRGQSRKCFESITLIAREMTSTKISEHNRSSFRGGA
jgi:hypothetical protein